MRTSVPPLALHVIVAFLAVAPLRAAETNAPAPAAPVASAPNIADLLGLAKGLTINPKVISPTDGADLNLGIEYKYERQLGHRLGAGGRDLEFYAHSEGLLVMDRDESPNRLLTHGLRLTIVDLFPSRRLEGAATEQQRQFNQRVTDLYYTPWQQHWQGLQGLPAGDPHRDELREQMDAIATTARGELLSYGELESNLEEGQWYFNGDTEESLFDRMQARLIKPRPVFLSWDFDADAETDQTFRDVQLVGSTQIRGKLLLPWLDYPFALLRGYKTPKNPLNRNGGPWFWFGAAVVDPSGNDSRLEIDPDDDLFPRAHAGLFFRTELFASTESKAVSLELLWRYYRELDAPSGIREVNLDQTSYFQATILFPGNMFLQYTDGKLPIDIEGASTVAAGWRYNF